MAEHTLGDDVPATLKNHFAVVCEMDADVGTVELFLNNQRLVGNEGNRLAFAKMLVVGSPSGPK